jgi:hypothetical protein
MILIPDLPISIGQLPMEAFFPGLLFLAAQYYHCRRGEGGIFSDNFSYDCLKMRRKNEKMLVIKFVIVHLYLGLIASFMLLGYR